MGLGTNCADAKKAVAIMELHRELTKMADALVCNSKKKKNEGSKGRSLLRTPMP